jgi:glutamine synthetase
MTASGASWAPKTPTYGGNDRTHYIRVPDSARIELARQRRSRPIHLAIAAAVEGGVDGIKRSADQARSVRGQRAGTPPTLLHAIDEFEADLHRGRPRWRQGEGVAAYFATSSATSSSPTMVR